MPILDGEDANLVLPNASSINPLETYRYQDVYGKLDGSPVELDTDGVLLPEGFRDLTVWRDLIDVAEEVVGTQTATYIQDLLGQRDPHFATNSPTIDRSTLLRLISMIGFKYKQNDIFNEADLKRFVRHTPKFWTEKGYRQFIQYMSYVVNAQLSMEYLWTQDYKTFVPEGSPQIGAKVWETNFFTPTQSHLAYGTGSQTTFLLLQDVDDPPGNLLPDPGFETYANGTNLATSQTNAGTLVATTADSFQGLVSAKLTRTTTGFTQNTDAYFGPVYPTKFDKVYLIEAWIKRSADSTNTGSSTVRLGLMSRNAAGTRSWNSSTPAVAVSSIGMFTKYFTSVRITQADAVDVQMWATLPAVAGANTNGCSVLIDNVVWRDITNFNDGVTNPVPAYSVEGDPTFYRTDWQGTAYKLFPNTRTNYSRNSQTFGGAGWTINGSPTLTTNAAPAPNGTNTAAQVILPSNNAGWWASTIFTNPGDKCVHSVFVKWAGGTGELRFALGGVSFTSGQNPAAIFNAQTGRLVSANAWAEQVGIMPLADGWYRLSIAATATGSGQANMAVYGTGNGGSSTVQVWGTQCEPGTEVGSYIPTAGAAGFGLDYTLNVDKTAITLSTPLAVSGELLWSGRFGIRGTWYPTSHVYITYDVDKFMGSVSSNFSSQESLAQFFYTIAPIELVIKSFVLTLTMDPLILQIAGDLQMSVYEPGYIEPPVLKPL